MEEVSELVQFKREDRGGDEIIITHHLRQLLLFLNHLQLGLFLLYLSLEGAIRPKLHR